MSGAGLPGRASITCAHGNREGTRDLTALLLAPGPPCPRALWSWPHRGLSRLCPQETKLNTTISAGGRNELGGGVATSHELGQGEDSRIPNWTEPLCGGHTRAGSLACGGETRRVATGNLAFITAPWTLSGQALLVPLNVSKLRPGQCGHSSRACVCDDTKARGSTHTK